MIQSQQWSNSNDTPIFDDKLHGVNVLNVFIAEPGAFYAMDRAYLDFERLYRLH